MELRPAAMEDLQKHKQELVEIMDYSIKVNGSCPGSGGVLRSTGSF